MILDEKCRFTFSGGLGVFGHFWVLSQRSKYLEYCSIIGIEIDKFIQNRWGSDSPVGRGMAV